MQLLREDLSWFLLIKIARWASEFTTKEANFDLKQHLCRQREAYKLRYCEVGPFKGEIMTCDMVGLQKKKKSQSWVKTATATGYRDWSANTIKVRYRKGRGYFFEEVWVGSTTSGSKIRLFSYACMLDGLWRKWRICEQTTSICALEMCSTPSGGLTTVGSFIKEVKNKNKNGNKQTNNQTKRSKTTTTTTKTKQQGKMKHYEILEGSSLLNNFIQTSDWVQV